jgi:hypothetical protein
VPSFLTHGVVHTTAKSHDAIQQPIYQELDSHNMAQASVPTAGGPNKIQTHDGEFTDAAASVTESDQMA